MTGGPRALLDEKGLREWVKRDVERTFHPASEARTGWNQVLQGRCRGPILRRLVHEVPA